MEIETREALSDDSVVAFVKVDTERMLPLNVHRGATDQEVLALAQSVLDAEAQQRELALELGSLQTLEQQLSSELEELQNG